MKKLTIYGLPLNPMPLLEQVRGASFCVSYATRGKLGAQLDQAIELVGDDQMLLVDNGAFSLHQQGGSTMDESYLDAFEEWAGDILERCPQAVAVVPDVIGGTEEQNRDLAMMCQLDSDRCMGVWHMHESLEYLTWLCETFGHVGIGSSAQFWQVGTPAWHARIKEMFAAIERWELEGEGAYIRPRLHMLRAQSMAHLYDFDSSDSVNVAMNHGRYRKQGEGHVGRFARRVNDKIQASAGREAEHQVKRPLLDHMTAKHERLIATLEAAGYVISEPQQGELPLAA